MKVCIFILTVIVVARAQTQNASVGCCRQSVYPDNKVWISNPSGSKIDYTFYDPYGLVTKIFAHEVDPSGKLVQTKTLDVDASSIKCPQGFKTTNPKHAELTKNSHAQVLCVNKDGKLKANKWYGVCRDRTCVSCHLDRTEATNTDPEYVTIKSKKIQGNGLVLELEVKNPGVFYNVSMEIGVSRESMSRFTINPTQRSYTLQVPNVTDNVYRHPIYLFVDPYVQSSASGCSTVGRRQVTTMSPFSRPSN